MENECKGPEYLEYAVDIQTVNSRTNAQNETLKQLYLYNLYN